MDVSLNMSTYYIVLYWPFLSIKANNNEQMAMEPLMNGHRGGGNNAGPGKNGGGAPVVTEATAAVKAAATNAVDTNNIRWFI